MLAASRKDNDAPSVLVLLSGGLDSAACTTFYRAQHYDVSALFVEYGQAAVRLERHAARRVARRVGARFASVRLSGLGNFGKGYVPARNALLVTTALSYWKPVRKGMIALGIHAGTAYPDCSPGFVDAMQRLIDIYTDGRIRLACPFLTWTKSQIWSYCHEAAVPIELTYSCERGSQRPCGRCLSCRDRKALRGIQ